MYISYIYICFLTYIICRCVIFESGHLSDALRKLPTHLRLGPLEVTCQLSWKWFPPVTWQMNGFARRSPSASSWWPVKRRLFTVWIRLELFETMGWEEFLVQFFGVHVSFRQCMFGVVLDEMKMSLRLVWWARLDNAHCWEMFLAQFYSHISKNPYFRHFGTHPNNLTTDHISTSLQQNPRFPNTLWLEVFFKPQKNIQTKHRSPQQVWLED